MIAHKPAAAFIHIGLSYLSSRTPPSFAWSGTHIGGLRARRGRPDRLDRVQWPDADADTTLYIVIRYKVQPGSGNAEITTGIVDLSWTDMP